MKNAHHYADEPIWFLTPEARDAAIAEMIENNNRLQDMLARIAAIEAEISARARMWEMPA